MIKVTTPAAQKVLFCILLTGVLVSCGFTHLKTSPELALEVDSKTVGYAQVRDQILKPNCLSCHSGLHAPDLTTYENTKAALAQIHHATLIDMTMPQSGPLSPKLRGLLQAWIRAGAPEIALGGEPTSTPRSEPILRPVHFTQLKARVLTPSCNSCHAKNNPEGITELESFTSFNSVVNLVLPLITGKSGDDTIPPEDRMPPPKAPPLTEEQKTIIQDWFQDGQLSD